MKTLNVMNIKEDDVLNRNEMKHIMAGSGSDCDPWEVYDNCTETAYQNYQDGVIDGSTLAEFYDTHCKESAASCY